MGRAGSGSRMLPVPRRWLEIENRAPRRSIRLRLTALYTTVLVFSSAALLTIAYLLAHETITERHPYREALLRLGLHPAAGQVYGLREGSKTAKVVHAVAKQIANNALHKLLIAYVIAFVVLVVFSVIVGWLVAGRALAPLRRITATARRVSGENLGERIDHAGPDDELKELADTFDGMLSRLDSAFASQRHFVANASHELRTPLAIMRTEVDVALADPDAGTDELRAMGEAILETVDRCEQLIASLLILARSEAADGREEPLDVAAVAGDCITDLRARAQEAAVEVSAHLEPAWIDGHPGLIERMVANLIDNGIRHNQPGGHLTVQTAHHAGEVVLVVGNGGARIDPADVAGLTVPFRRLDRSVSGFGLGLSIVRSVAEAHHGSAELTAPASGGLTVTVRLPARAGSPSANPQALLTGS
jgi:signal transduction histidine kinase